MPSINLFNLRNFHKHVDSSHMEALKRVFMKNSECLFSINFNWIYLNLIKFYFMHFTRAVVHNWKFVKIVMTNGRVSENIARTKKNGLLFVKHVFICKICLTLTLFCIDLRLKIALEHEDTAAMARNLSIINHQSIDLVLGISSMRAISCLWFIQNHSSMIRVH